jgi:hypothetical protein
MSSNHVEIKDFGNIGISFSGGGYRAAAFHLGSLDLLQKVGLLEQVTMLSTVSGGTITGAKYVCALAESIEKKNPDFYENFFDELSNFLLKVRLPDLWLKRLNNVKNPDSPSLIAIAAKVYNDTIFKQIKFDLPLKYQSKLHLQEIIFNTTELRTGTNFRFRIGQGGLIGNGNLPIPKKLLKNLRIADVVAASSCFPGGFEPLIFPDDFFDSRKDWQKLSKEIILSLKKGEQHSDDKNESEEITQKIVRTIDLIDREPLPLVDAGIYDNLGVESILLANNRLKTAKLFDRQVDTLIISDTDNIGLSQDPLKVNEKQSLLSVQSPLKGNWITHFKLNHLFLLIKFLLFVFTISTFLFIGSAFFGVVQSRGFSLEFLLKIWGGIISAVIALVISKVENFIRVIASVTDSNNNSHQTKNIFVDAVKEIIVDWSILVRSLGDLSIVAMLNMLSRRLGSISSLFLAFLKGQRRKSYTYIEELKKTDYSQSLLQGDRSFKTINNYILETNHQYNSPHRKNDKKILPDNLIPSKKMADISLIAGQMSTTLWFDLDPIAAQKQLNDLIACGQFTLCFKLLEMIEEMKKNHGDLSPEMEIINNKLLKAWEQFNQNPYAWVGDNRSQALINYQ